MRIRLGSILFIAGAALTAFGQQAAFDAPSGGQEQTLQGLEQTLKEAGVQKFKSLHAVKPAKDSEVEAAKQQAVNPSATTATLPLWTFFVESPRDDGAYTGIMVGRDPFNGGGSASVTTYVVPLILVTNTVIKTLNSNMSFTTQPGVTAFDPSIPDNSCLGTTNNIPLTLFQKSPLLQQAAFDFGGTVVGKTQYVDAFQRANFWKILGDQVSDYHITLGPVHTLAPIVINVPAAKGTSLPITNPIYCSPLGIIDIDWFDSYLDAVVLPALGASGVNPSNLPIFLVHNVVWMNPLLNTLEGCCILGYHSTSSLPIQTYTVGDFESTAHFDVSAHDTVTLSHELAEWVNDPFGSNATPPWETAGQPSAGCQSNLEVGDRLTGTEAPRIVMPNGFTYHLQELAFFSWFFGAPSVAVHGWFSNNGTFLTDAGPPCQSSSAVSSQSKWIVR